MARSNIIGRVIYAVAPWGLVGYARIDTVDTARMNAHFGRVRAALMMGVNPADFTKPMLCCVTAELVQLQLVLTLFYPQVDSLRS